MGSSLDFAPSEAFRKKLMARNLVAYTKSPYKPEPPLNYEIRLTDSAVIDSPDDLIDVPTFANDLYPLNQYGSEGGYKELRDPNTLQNRKSNEGEYGFQDAHLVDEGYSQTKEWQKINPYADPQNIIDSAEAFSTLDAIQVDRGRGTNAQPYPSTFVPSFYGPVSILLLPDPQGSDGLLSQDSYIAKLGAKLLKKEFQERIGREIIQRTIARANVFNARSGTDVLNMATGIVPLIEPNYVITVPSNPLVAATDLALRLAGSYIPVSPIPGSYFDPNINTGQPTTIQQLNNAFRRSTVGKFVNRILGATQTGSQLFLNNTGGGQKSRLFGNINYNKYKPGYDRTLFDRVAGVLVGSTTNNSNFYVGSITSEPSRVFSPSGALPVDSFGVEQQMPVYGPSELAALYEEGTAKEVKIGANGVAYVNGGGIEGGLTWISPGTESNAGKRVGLNGEIVNSDTVQVNPSFSSTVSSNKVFKDGSILYNTQKIIDAAGKSGGKKLQHVGNAIDQISKVFNDGYNMMTKGSKVIKYVGPIGLEAGTEYCRVFSKDIPYLQYNDLQKVDGMTTEGRKYSYSVMDNTYNLNIYPVSQSGGADSTNLIGNGQTGYVKKYMFSLENLAWSTSNKPGYTVSDLPICERGPNGGRVMWFPPYDLKFSESVSASWKATDFLGRPEPIYTYINTNRTGSLSWKVVVDHPSVLNVITNKILSNENDRKIFDQKIDAFFAGCLKYDLYELAKRYATVTPNDLYYIQQQIDEGKVTPEETVTTVNNLANGSDGNPASVPTTQATNNTATVNEELNRLFKDKGFYFANDYPQKNQTVTAYNQQYNLYISQKPLYQKQSTSGQTINFFDFVVTSNYNDMTNLIDKIKTNLSSNPKNTITITLEAGASAPQTNEYNNSLADRRYESVISYFKNNGLSNFITNQQLIFSKSPTKGENVQVTKLTADGKGFEPNGVTYPCTDNTNDTEKVGSKEVFTIKAMACRSVRITNINAVINQPEVPPPSDPTPQGKLLKSFTKAVQPNINEIKTQKPGLSKKILRNLLSECDYFQAIKEDTPMVYDNLKEKLKFFNPTFHSITPEGLNSRLTFLQQCMRPGDTIPVVKPQNFNQPLSYSNATNTSFGAPPVLVLRVGDFYNTKIIPDNLNIQFEGLDINPEGIGIQPMIANITLSFKFVGGSGLKEAVDRLQNALSFNYYANTEMYDERAKPTDDSYKTLDQSLFTYFDQGTPNANQVQNNNSQSNSDTIGTILTSVNVNDIQTGTTDYNPFMERIKNETQNYFQLIINKNKELIEQYNNSVRQNLTTNRLYASGTFIDTTVKIYGKPENFQNLFNGWFDKMKDNVKDEVDPYISYLIGLNVFSDKVIRNVKNNYIKFLKSEKGNFSSSITTIINDLSKQQQNYTKTLSQGNVIHYSGTSGNGGDGSQQLNGSLKIYYFNVNNNDGTTLNSDLAKIATNLSEYKTLITNTTDFQGPNKKYSSSVIYEGSSLVAEIFKPISDKPEFLDTNFKLMYSTLNQYVVDVVKYLDFKKALIGSIENNDNVIGKGASYKYLAAKTDYFWIIKTKPVFNDENKLGTLFLEQLERNQLKDFINYTPYPSRKRVFEYTTAQLESDPTYTIRKNYISYLGATTNDPKYPNNTWNDLDAGAYRPKINFN